PWSARGGNAHLNLQAERLSFEVMGLVLAGGNGIGTPGSVANVRGTLVCDTDASATGSSVLVDTPPVELRAEGKATFSGPAGPLPTECLEEPDMAFLIRVSGQVRAGELRPQSGAGEPRPQSRAALRKAR